VLVAAWTTDNRWPPAVCLAGHQWLCSHAPLNWTLGSTVQGAHELWPSIMQYVLAARETVVIRRRPSRVNIVAQGLSTPDPSLSPTHLSIRRGHATTTHYTHHQVSLVVSRNTTLVPSPGVAHLASLEVGLSAGMRREPVSPQIWKKEEHRRQWSPTHNRIHWDKFAAVDYS